MDPSRVLEPTTLESNQDYKRRCFENLEVQVSCGKVKVVYVRKDAKVANVVEEQKKVSDDVLVVDEKMVGEAVQETDLSLNGLNEMEKEESGVRSVETGVSLIVSSGEDQEESTVELVESESVDENDDVLKLNLEMDVVTGKIVEEDQDVCESAIVGSKKVVYSREELEALRFMDEDGQTSKWIEVYCSFAPLVARELCVDIKGRKYPQVCTLNDR